LLLDSNKKWIASLESTPGDYTTSQSNCENPLSLVECQRLAGLLGYPVSVLASWVIPNQPRGCYVHTKFNTGVLFFNPNGNDYNGANPYSKAICQPTNDAAAVAAVAPSTIIKEENHPKNTSLVIVIGNLRSGEQAWDTLYKNVLDVNRADLALLIGEEPNKNMSQPSHSNSSMFERAKFVWTFPEYEDWADALDELTNGTSWRQTHLPYLEEKVKKGGLFGGIRGFGGSGLVIFAIRWFLSQRLRANPELLEQYERFVITRSDHYYLCPHRFVELDLRNQTIYIPPGEDWGGVTDRHLVVSRDDILDAIDILPPFFSNPPERDDLIHNHNPERLLKHRWLEKGLRIRYHPRTMFTCAVRGDQTRWRKPRGAVPNVPGLFLKYPAEYRHSKKVCGFR